MNKATKGSNMMCESSRMMLPEHVEALRHRKEEQKKLPKHELDEQELEEISIVIMDSLKYKLEVKITYWKEGYYREMIGVVDLVDVQTKKIKPRVDDDIEYLFIDCLKQVERL
ncbi:YolD-like family protein [Halalkalibacter flavus]|uniref:YolD-like family protein n=1 Tax=Halalkalibacter flavus TaxID=3090668 RepID=UPI002FCB6D90